MTSILTNISAMVALQTLSQINNSLNETNNRVSTGLRIREAADSSAYWAISTTTSSDNGALSTVSDALAIGKATLDVMYNGLDSIRDNLQTMKELLVAARQPGVDRANIQTQLNGLVTDMQNKAQASVINEQNFLAVADSQAAGFNATKSTVASFERTAAGIQISTVDLDITDIILTDGTATVNQKIGILDQLRSRVAGNDGILDTADDFLGADGAVGGGDDVNADEDRYNATYAGADGVYNTADDFLGADGVAGGGDDVAAEFASVAVIGSNDTVSRLTDSAADLGQLELYVEIVDRALTDVISAQNTVGVTLDRITTQETFVSLLMDANARAVGSLIDADMEAESTKLRALQTQQQLSVQSLSIANSSAQSILQLFQ